LRNGGKGENNGGFATLLLSSNRNIVVACSGGFGVVLCKGCTATPVGTLKSVSGDNNLKNDMGVLIANCIYFWPPYPKKVNIL
jgi:hypothetical protein